MPERGRASVGTSHVDNARLDHKKAEFEDAAASHLLASDSSAVLGDPSRRPLTEEEKLLLISNVGIGRGINLNTSRLTSLPALSDIKSESLEHVGFHRMYRSETESYAVFDRTVTQVSDRTWTKADITAQGMVFAATKVTLNSSFDRSTASAKQEDSFSVHGRCCYTAAEINLYDEAQVLRPNVVARIESALAKDDPAERRDAVGRVFEDFGHLVVTSAEVGAAKVLFRHYSCTQISKVSDLLVEAGFKAAGEAGLLAVGASGGYESAKSLTGSQESEKNGITTLGGDQRGDTVQWRRSLGNPSLWQAICITRLRPLVELFEPSIQLAIDELGGYKSFVDILPPSYSQSQADELGNMSDEDWTRAVCRHIHDTFEAAVPVPFRVLIYVKGKKYKIVVDNDDYVCPTFTLRNSNTGKEFLVFVYKRGAFHHLSREARGFHNWCYLPGFSEKNPTLQNETVPIFNMDIREARLRLSI